MAPVVILLGAAAAAAVAYVVGTSKKKTTTPDPAKVDARTYVRDGVRYFYPEPAAAIVAALGTVDVDNPSEETVALIPPDPYGTAGARGIVWALGRNTGATPRAILATLSLADPASKALRALRAVAPGRELPFASPDGDFAVLAPANLLRGISPSSIVLPPNAGGGPRPAGDVPSSTKPAFDVVTTNPADRTMIPIWFAQKWGRKGDGSDWREIAAANPGMRVQEAKFEAGATVPYQQSGLIPWNPGQRVNLPAAWR